MTFTKAGNPKLSVVVLTYNEEHNLPGCLESIHGLNAEVFVVDSGSTDSTRQIAEAAGAQVFEHPFENYAAQRNWAQQNLPIHTEWVLHLDADERLTPELVKEISSLMGAGSTERGARSSREQGTRSREHGAGSTEPGAESANAEAQSTKHGDEVNGFLLRKRTIFMGKWIKHGGHYPAYHLRLFRKDKGGCEDRLYDQHFVVEGKVERLQNDYLDILASDIGTWTTRHVRWADLEAREIVQGYQGGARVNPKFFGNPIERRRWLREGFYARWPLFLRPFLYFFYRYFLRLGFLDGKEGFIFHFLQGFWFRLLVDIKLEEIRAGSREQGARSGEPRAKG
jgi:glycosyltransferase involved in cell wall biosynthesis